MFTGIIEQIGTVVDAKTTAQGRKLIITGDGLSRLSVGASIAVNGACLTAVGVEDDQVALDVVPETLNKTTFGDVEPGDSVNLELPMAASGRFDGHIVQGHVDGVGRVRSVEQRGGGTVMTLSAPEALSGQIVEKGSIAVDGVSLTVSGMNGGRFDVALIPHTLEATTLGLRKPGDAVNLETDIIAKYVQRMTEANT